MTTVGGVATGIIFLDPIPDQAYTLLLDCVCYPVILTTDGVAEAIPYPWTDAIPYFATYLALMDLQRYEEALKMKELYTEFVGRGRTASNPTIAQEIWAKSQDPAQMAKFGLAPSQSK
jgi:hypothetical protein